uniref:Uncharacterized protein n=1 Tax=Anopheles melas TaxID=34690 RepID=A0A182TTG7_9DIPT
MKWIGMRQSHAKPCHLSIASEIKFNEYCNRTLDLVSSGDDQTVTHEPAATMVMMMMPLLSALATAAHCRCTRILRHTCGATTEQRTSPPTHAGDVAKVPVARDDAECRGTIVPYRARLAAATETIVIDL